MNDGVSVIIPTYNRSGLLGRAVRSVLAATSPGDEVLVIDDGSTDDTPQAVRSFGDAVRYFRIDNSGPGAARNLGIRLAERPLVAFLDSDDEWLPDKLELQRKVMHRFPEAVFCFGNVLARHADGEVIHDILSVWRGSPRVGSASAPTHLSGFLGPGVSFSSFAELPGERADFTVHVGDMYPAEMEVHYVCSCAAMVRKELAGDAFRFAEDTRLMEDWECFARVARAGPGAYLDCEVAVQNVHASSRLTDANDMQQAAARIRVLRRIWGADQEFLGTHATRYQELLSAQHLHRARVMFGSGRSDEARRELTQIGGGPPVYRVLASLPAPLVRELIGIKRKLWGRNRDGR
jgi:Glycosyl transferase family 2